jgi:hypothetical protein
MKAFMVRVVSFTSLFLNIPSAFINLARAEAAVSFPR